MRGIRAKDKRLGVFQWLKRFHYGSESFILLQETHSTVEIEKIWENDWGTNKILSAVEESSLFHRKGLNTILSALMLILRVVY